VCLDFEEQILLIKHSASSFGCSSVHLVSLFAGEMNSINKRHIVGRNDSLFFSVSQVNSHICQYNRNQIRVLGLKLGILRDVNQRVISDSFLNILFFLSFVKFSFVAMKTEIDPNLLCRWTFFMRPSCKGFLHFLPPA
jgi:hypothetical protein